MPASSVLVISVLLAVGIPSAGATPAALPSAGARPALVLSGDATSGPSVSGNGDWVAHPTAEPAVPAGTITSVSCDGTPACTAVGYHAEPSGNTAAWAERWSGSSWNLEATAPVLPVATAAELEGVSCTSLAWCMSVGFVTDGSVTTPLTETWNGKQWSLHPAPAPTGATGSGLLAVACSAESACEAVGEYTVAGGKVLSLAESWDGTRWALQQVPGPAGATGSKLLGVSCPAPTSCVAVGGYGDSAGEGLTMAEAWDGSNWRVEATPNPAGDTGAGLAGVSCTSVASCTAVGDYDDSGGGSQVLAERWNGQSWSIQPTPDPATASHAGLASVSCTAVNCIAVGTSGSSPLAPTALSEVWDGARWTIEPAPGPAGSTGSSLLGVSCAAGACTAVGSFEHGTNSVGVPLVEHWSGTGWSSAASASPPSASISRIAALACAPNGACTAVGTAETGAGATAPLVESWSGSAQAGATIEAAQDPAGSPNAELSSVSCTFGGQCVAVGFYYDPQSRADHPLVEMSGGGLWHIVALPQVPDPSAGAELRSVSCTSASACTAVGQSGGRPLAMAWNGAAWLIEAPPTPAGASSGSLAGVSCTSAASCTAVGDYVVTGGGRTLAERWTGSGWVMQPTPGSAGSTLAAVSCSAASSCTAVGSRQSSGGGETLAETWNGTTWRLQSSPNPGGAGASPSLSSVSCGSQSSCTAVGSYSSSGGLPVAFAEVSDGAVWIGQQVTGPASTVDSALSAVSCSVNGCTAAGYRQGSAGIQVPFAVTGSPVKAIAAVPGAQGYWLASAAGTVVAAAGAQFLGDTRAISLARPVSSMAVTGDGKGYLLCASDGGVFAYGDASFEQSLPGLGVHVGDIVGIAETPDGKGYWMAGADGGVFTFGDAKYRGSLPALGVHVSDIVGIEAASSGAGYLLVGADGGVFAFGTGAGFHGSLPGLGVHVHDVVSLAEAAGGAGYVMAGADGGIFVFGNGVTYRGSLPAEGIRVTDVVGLALGSGADSYRVAEASGTVWNFGAVAASGVALGHPPGTDH